MFRRTFISCYRTVVLQCFSVVSLYLLEHLRPCEGVIVGEIFSVKTAALYLPATARQERDCTSTVLTDLISLSFCLTEAFGILCFAGQGRFAFQFASNAQMEIMILPFFLLISQIGRAEEHKTIPQNHPL